ncbi:FtsK/SpoIIIE domain-containing protein [Nakamurella lactea]|uniref:FtsK/SpoIIIE domain-containing protein n=1 Tax=Nakamurella lactea TaxID=459515 RepID=UPI00049190CA|nr:FtsK/SpoIIIE domain-containing protein [Nakamurella lactea]
MICLSVIPSRGSGIPPVDVEVRAETGATVGDLARALGSHLQGGRSRTLFAPTTDGAVWPADRLLAETGLRNGQLISVESVPDGWLRATDRRPASAVVAIIEVLAGPDAGRTYELTGRSATIGRGSSSTVQLSDPDVSRRHCHLELDGEPTVIDDGSASGTFQQGVANQDVSIRRPTLVPFGTRLRLGTTVLLLSAPPHRADPAPATRSVESGSALGSGAVTRTPRFGVSVPEAEVDLPSPPSEPSPHHFPWAMLAMPLVLGASMMSTMGLGRSMVYLLAWPVAMIGGHLIQRRQELSQHRKDVIAWRDECDEIRQGVAKLAVAQRDQAYQDDPEVNGLARRLANRQLVWVRTPRDPDFLSVRVGIGTVPAKTRLKAPQLSPGAELREEIRGLIAAAATIDELPVTPDVLGAKVFGVVGSAEQVDAAVRSLLIRIAVNHSPFDVSICAALSPARRDLEGVLRWLPHAGPRPGGAASVTIGPAAGRALVESLAEGSGGNHHVICVVDEAAGVPRRVVESLATGQGHCTVIWLGAGRHHAPAATGVLLDLIGGAPADGPSVLIRDRGGVLALDRVDGLDLTTSWEYARQLSAFRDVAATVAPDTALPGAVRFTELGSDLDDLDDATAICRRWAGSTGLRAQIGVGVDGLVSLDLREDGPHGLVAGTTGAGKSELLQSLIVSLAANNPPSRMTFLLVDYKGGAAFRECADLPHTVGYITDLTPALVHRALVSMNAELTWREHILAEYGAKDLLALERDHPEAAPPSMLICVDEFAALLAEVPDFIDGMVSIAQRGRSLGMHMILATQRPSGVISDQIKANTDLRIALRVASGDDSDDVIETTDAARISRRTPGRAWIRRTGHGSTELVQVAYVGGREPVADSLSPVSVRPHSAIEPDPSGAFGPAGSHGAAGAHRVNPRTDLDRLVDTVNRAHGLSGRPDPRLPWLPALPESLPLPAQAGTEPGVLTLGLLDDPANQRQIPLELDLARAGNALIYGTSGSGKTAALRACAVAALTSTDEAPTLIYGIDAAGGGLVALEELPNVASVVPLAGLERTLRLIRTLKRLVDERNALLAGTGAADLVDLARIGHTLPRVLLLIDNLPAMVDTIDAGNMMRRSHYALFESLLQDGRRCGVHVIGTSPQRGGLAMQLLATVGARLVLRMTTEDDYSMLGVPMNILDADAAAGRALFGRLEAQIADATVDPAALADAARAWDDRHSGTRVTKVPVMPDRVSPTALPVGVGGTTYLGVEADSVTAVGVPLGRRPLLVCGRTGSGRTSLLAGIGQALRRQDAGLPILAVSPRSSGAFDRFGAVELGRPDQALAELTAMLDRLGAPTTDGQVRAAILVDDVHRLEERWDHDEIVRDLLGALAGLVGAAAAGERSDIALLAAVHTDQLRDATMQSGLVDALHRTRRSVLLMPHDNDGMPAGCDVPSYPMEPLTGIGRGLLVEAGAARVLQFVTAG